MAEGERPAYCGQCGNPVYGEDRFCGVCGTAVLASPQQAEQVIPRQTAASHGDVAGGRRRVSVLAVVAGAVLVLLVGGGALAAAALDGGLGLLGGADRQANTPNNAPENVAEESSPSSQASSEPTTSSAPTEPTTSPAGEEPTMVDLLQQFVSDYYDAIAREDWAATYSMLDEESKQKITEEEWAQAQADLAASDGYSPVASATVEGPYVSETQVPFSTNVTLTFEDGTSETREVSLVSEYVVNEPSDYYRHLTDEEVSYLERLLGEGSAGEATTAASPESTTSGSYGQSTEEIEAEAQAAAEEYYQAAGVGEWGYTYERLDAETQSYFTKEEWFLKNQWFADNGSVIYHIESVERLGTSSGVVVEVTLRLTYGDGSSSPRTTYFVLEGGEWKHAFGQEEYDLFMPEASYEEFLAAQQ